MAAGKCAFKCRLRLWVNKSVAAWRDCRRVNGADEVGRIVEEVDAVKSAIACVIVGIGCSGFSLFGDFDKHVSYSSLEALQGERVRRTALMAKGIDSPIWNVAVDEWKAISRNVRAIVDRKTKQIIALSAKPIMGEMITLARETNIRIFALGQGR